MTSCHHQLPYQTSKFLSFAATVSGSMTISTNLASHPPSKHESGTGISVRNRKKVKVKVKSLLSHKLQPTHPWKIFHGCRWINNSYHTSLPQLMSGLSDIWRMMTKLIIFSSLLIEINNNCTPDSALQALVLGLNPWPFGPQYMLYIRVSVYTTSALSASN